MNKTLLESYIVKRNLDPVHILSLLTNAGIISDLVVTAADVYWVDGLKACWWLERNLH